MKVGDLVKIDTEEYMRVPPVYPTSGIIISHDLWNFTVLWDDGELQDRLAEFMLIPIENNKQ